MHGYVHVILECIYINSRMTISCVLSIYSQLPTRQASRQLRCWSLHVCNLP